MLPVLPESWCYDVDIDSRDGNSSLFCLALLKGASIEKKSHEFFLEMWKNQDRGNHRTCSDLLERLKGERYVADESNLPEM